MPKGKKKGKAKHGFDSDDEEDAPAPKDEQQIEEEATAAAKKEKKKAKKAKKAKGAAQDEPIEDTKSFAHEESTDVPVEGEPENDEDDLGETLIVAEVYEVKTHPKLAATQLLVTLFDGQDMYKVVTEYALQDEDLIVYAKAGCILPGTQQRVGQQKIKGVKSEGKICSAYDVGWLSEPTEDLLLLEESWGVISGDVCPMAPPSGWVQLQEAEAEQAAEDFAAEGDDVMDEESDPAAPSTSAAAEKGGKGGAKQSSAFAALMDEDDGPEAEVQADEPKAAVKNGKGGKKGKAGKGPTDFAALMDSDDDSVAEEAPQPKNGKGKKKGGNAFADLLDDDDDEVDEPAPAPSKSKKKKKEKAAKSAFSGLVSDDEADENSTMVPEAAESEINLVTTPVDSLASIEQVTAALACTGISKTRKQGLKQRLKKLEEDAVLSELDSVPAPNDSGKKKGVAAKASDDTPQEIPVQEMTSIDDVQAAMDAPGVSKTRKQKLKQRLKQLQDEKAAAEGGGAMEQSVTELPVDALTTVEQVQAALDDPGVSKTRKQKLKQRLKALQDADKPKEEAPVESEAKGAKGKKPSAAVRAMQQQVEERRRAEEEARAAAEAEKAAKEETERQAELELQREEEERIRKAEEKKAQREQMRKEGKLLSTKQKAEARKLAAERELRLAKAQEAGLTLDGPAEGKLTVAQQEEKRRQAKKRQKELAEQRAKEQAAAELAALEKKRAAEKEEREAAEQKKKEEAAKAAKAAEAADDWEDEVPDDWDASEGGSQAGAEEGSNKADAKDVQGEGSAQGDDSEESSSEEDSSEDDSSDDDDSSDYSTDSEEEREQRLAEARAKREARFSKAMEKRSKDDLRSPICCILGHVDTGKTKILDNIRRTNVQTGEAGGITQQIGATYIPSTAVENRTVELRKDKAFDMKMPGLLVIDTPGHESFSNLRSRGSSLCDIAVLVVDIMHGLEQQTIESINLLKMRKSPFVIALNKIDRMYNWKVMENGPVRDSLEQQEQATKNEFEKRCSDSMLALNEQGLNVELYWRNKDPRRFVNIVPTSAITGEGICDLMWLIVKLTQSMMMDRLMFVEELQCTVLEVKVVEGYGHTIDAVLVNGRVREGDKVVICGLQGPIVTHIRSLLTPHPLKELRVKNTYIHHKEIKAAQGIKMSAPNLEHAVAGTQMYVVGKDDDEEELKELVMEDMSDIFDKKEPEGVCVQASTLGSLEALLEFLSSDAVQIPVSGINIGPVHKKDIMRANIMAEKKLKKYACLLAFDVPINKEATALANTLGVTVFSADIIYHLFDMFTDYTKKCKADEKADAQMDAVFPCRMRIVPNCVFNAKDPIVLGCEILEGQLRMGTPITVPGKDCDLGRVAGMEKDHKSVEIAERGDSVAVKIEAQNSTEGSRLFGRHFLETDELYSKITRESINALKAHFRDEMTQPLWQLVIKLKKVFKID